MKKKLLIVDDDNKMLELLELEFIDEGYQPIVASDGFDALNKLRKTDVDLIMLDIKMPGMDGIEALERIMSIDRKTPVIIHSAYSHFKENYRTWAAADYVVKSGNLDQLKKAVSKQLTERNRV